MYVTAGAVYSCTPAKHFTFLWMTGAWSATQHQYPRYMSVKKMTMASYMCCMLPKRLLGNNCFQTVIGDFLLENQLERLLLFVSPPRSHDLISPVEFGLSNVYFFVLWWHLQYTKYSSLGFLHVNSCPSTFHKAEKKGGQKEITNICNL